MGFSIVKITLFESRGSGEDISSGMHIKLDPVDFVPQPHSCYSVNPVSHIPIELKKFISESSITSGLL